jgi:DNA-binding MarR family transcriptional regulator
MNSSGGTERTGTVPERVATGPESLVSVPEALVALQSAMRVLTGVALKSLEVLDGAVTLPQFRMLAVLADIGPARSARVARALGLEPSTVTRLADRLVATGHVRRGSEDGHRGVVTLELTAPGQLLVDKVAAWRQQELARMVSVLSPDEQASLTSALEVLLAAAGDGFGLVSRTLVPS